MTFGEAREMTELLRAALCGRTWGGADGDGAWRGNRRRIFRTDGTAADPARPVLVRHPYGRHAVVRSDEAAGTGGDPLHRSGQQEPRQRAAGPPLTLALTGFFPLLSLKGTPLQPVRHRQHA